jgi:hypothetical protein
MPMNLVKTDMRPPNKREVTKTTTRVELTKRLELGERDGLIWRLRANAMAPLMMPLNQMSNNYLRVMLILKHLHMPTMK